MARGKPVRAVILRFLLPAPHTIRYASLPNRQRQIEDLPRPDLAREAAEIVSNLADDPVPSGTIAMHGYSYRLPAAEGRGGCGMRMLVARAMIRGAAGSAWRAGSATVVVEAEDGYEQRRPPPCA